MQVCIRGARFAINGTGIAEISEEGGGIEELRCNECQTGETGISEWTRPERRPLTHHPSQEHAATRLSASQPSSRWRRGLLVGQDLVHDVSQCVAHGASRRVLLYHGKVAVESTGTPGVSWDLVYSINTWVVLHCLGGGCIHMGV